MEIKKIEYGKLSVIDIFNDWYTVPSYQRHYVGCYEGTSQRRILSWFLYLPKQ